VLLDSTHKASAFSRMPRQPHVDVESTSREIHGHPCLASSWWPQTPNQSYNS
jgi:hypothetical protein